MMKKQSLIIVAGGSGSRMSLETPKQFLLIHNKPLLFYSIEAFHQYNPEIKIIIIIPKNHIDLWKSLCKKFQFPIQHEIGFGGNTRFESVKNGLLKIQDECFVAIHDGARPLIDIHTIDRLFKEAEKQGNAVPVIPINESIRKVHAHENKMAARADFKIVQTPQIFKFSDLKKAYTQEYQTVFTDDASVVENLGIKIHLAEGNPQNIKITQPIDLKLAEAFLSLK